MKNLKKIVLIAGLLLFSAVVSAQSGMYIEATQQYASFKFTDSLGEKHNDDYSGIFTGAYGVGYSYCADFGLMIRTGIGLRNAGATMVYDDMNYAWKLQYADINLGIGYMYKTERVNPYMLVSGYFGYLLRGTQRLNNEDFNITSAGLLKKSDYGLVFVPGLEIKITDNLLTYFNFKYLMGLNNIEVDEGQKTKNFAYALSLGLAINF